MRESMTKTSYGFREGRGIEDARLFLLSKLTTHRKEKRPVYIVFFDLVSAYDNVNLVRLRELLREFNVFDETQIQLWEWLAINQVVMMGGEMVETTNGIPQGSTLAPGMWNVYMHPLMLLLLNYDSEKASPDQFADDLASIMTSWNLTREVIRTFEKWCSENNMTPNRKKSGIMYLDWKPNSKGPEEKELYGYPVVREYK